MPSEDTDRAIIVGLVEKAYLLMTDTGDAPSDWPPGVLETLAEAVGSTLELNREYGADAIERLAVDIEALGDMRTEVFTAVLAHVASDAEAFEGGEGVT